MIIATLPAAPGTLNALSAALQAALPETRAFDGCLNIDVYQEEGTETLIEDWESPDHYDRYLNRQLEDGMSDLLDGLLDGGMEGLKVQKFQLRADI